MWNNTTPVTYPIIQRYGVVDYVIGDNPFAEAEKKARHKSQMTRAKNRNNRKKRSR